VIQDFAYQGEGTNRRRVQMTQESVGRHSVTLLQLFLKPMPEYEETYWHVELPTQSFV
jgi:hypothetical protein